MSGNIESPKWHRLRAQRWDDEALSEAGIDKRPFVSSKNKLLIEVLEYAFENTLGIARPSNFTRLCNGIGNGKLGSLEEFAAFGSKRLIRTPNIGRATVELARIVLQFYGFEFSDEIIPPDPIEEVSIPEIGKLVPAVISLDTCRLLITSGIRSIEQLKGLSEQEYLEICTPVLLSEFRRVRQL